MVLVGKQNVVGNEIGEIITEKIWMLYLVTWTFSRRDREINEESEEII
jgi:hypothetical protein